MSSATIAPIALILLLVCVVALVVFAARSVRNKERVKSLERARKVENEADNIRKDVSAMSVDDKRQWLRNNRDT